MIQSMPVAQKQTNNSNIHLKKKHITSFVLTLCECNSICETFCIRIWTRWILQQPFFVFICNILIDVDIHMFCQWFIFFLSIFKFCLANSMMYRNMMCVCFTDILWCVCVYENVSSIDSLENWFLFNFIACSCVYVKIKIKLGKTLARK